MTYRDMTFCVHHEDCAKAKDCPRPLTEQVREDAARWWGTVPGEVPIAYFLNKPKCHEAKQ